MQVEEMNSCTHTFCCVLAKHWISEFDSLYEETMAIEGQVPKPKSLRSMIDKL